MTQSLTNLLCLCLPNLRWQAVEDLFGLFRAVRSYLINRMVGGEWQANLLGLQEGRQGLLDKAGAWMRARQMQHGGLLLTGCCTVLNDLLGLLNAIRTLSTAW